MSTALSTDNHLFPLLMVRDHLGGAHETPEVFEGRTNVVVVAFYPEHRGQVDSWAPWLAEHAGHHQGFHYYELWAGEWTASDEAAHPVIAAGPVLDAGHAGRRLLYGGAAERLLTALRLEAADSIWTLSVSVDGLIHHVERGPYDQGAAERLDDALKSGA
jgi:hypothetical protein